MGYRPYEIAIIKGYNENYIRLGIKYSIYKRTDSVNILILIGGKNFKIFE